MEKQEKDAGFSLSERRTQIWETLLRFLRTFSISTTTKKIIIAFFLGVLVVFPLTIKQYEFLSTEVIVSTDKIIINDAYYGLFDELGNAVDGDTLIIYWFSVMQASYVLINIRLGTTVVYRMGIAQHDGSVVNLLEDVVGPMESDTNYQIETVMKGWYTCSLFVQGSNNSLVVITVTALVA